MRTNEVKIRKANNGFILIFDSMNSSLLKQEYDPEKIMVFTDWKVLFAAAYELMSGEEE